MRQWLAFWGLGLIWGSSFLLIKVAVEELGTLPLVSLRLGLAAALMLVYLKLSGRPFPTKRSDLLSIAFVGLFNVALPFSLITRAEESIDSSLATILNSSVPLFSLVIAHFALKDEKLNRAKIAGLLIGYVGIIVLTSRGLGASSSPLAGQVMMVAAVICYAGAVVFIRARLRHLEPLMVAGLSLVGGALFIIPLALATATLPDWGHLGSDTLFSIITLGTVNTVIAYFLFYYLISQWGARATLVTYVFPPVGVTLGAIFLDEPIDARLILGALLILGGIMVVNYKPKPRKTVAIEGAVIRPDQAGARTSSD